MVAWPSWATRASPGGLKLNHPLQAQSTKVDNPTARQPDNVTYSWTTPRRQAHPHPFNPSIQPQSHPSPRRQPYPHLSPSTAIMPPCWFLAPDFTFTQTSILRLGTVLSHPDRPTLALAPAHTGLPSPPSHPHRTQPHPPHLCLGLRHPHPLRPLPALVRLDLGLGLPPLRPRLRHPRPRAAHVRARVQRRVPARRGGRAQGAAVDRREVLKAEAGVCDNGRACGQDEVERVVGRGPERGGGGGG